MLDQKTGHQDKFKATQYNKGDLLYWSDFWRSDYGIGIFVEYDNNFNVKDIYSSNVEKTSSTWVKLLIVSKEVIEIRTFPQTSISSICNHKSLKEFKDYDSKFRFKKNR